jgi:hypothetical protein
MAALTAVVNLPEVQFGLAALLPFFIITGDG